MKKKLKIKPKKMPDGGKAPIKGTKEQYNSYLDSLNLYKAYQEQLKYNPPQDIKQSFIATHLDPSSAVYDDNVNAQKHFRNASAKEKLNWFKDNPTDYWHNEKQFREEVPEDAPLIDFYKNLTFSTPTKTGLWTTPDLHNSTIAPTDVYFGGNDISNAAWNPVFKKPVQPIQYDGDNTGSRSKPTIIGTKQKFTKPVQPIIYKPEENVMTQEQARVYQITHPNITWDIQHGGYKAIENRPKEQPIPMNRMEISSIHTNCPECDEWAKIVKKYNGDGSSPEAMRDIEKHNKLYPQYGNIETVPFKPGSYFTREQQGQEVGGKEYFDKKTGKKLMGNGGKLLKYLPPDVSRPSMIDPFTGESKSEYKMGFEVGGKEVTLPTVWQDPPFVNASQHSGDEAFQRFKDTGEHMGIHDTWQEGDIDAWRRTAKYNFLSNPVESSSSGEYTSYPKMQKGGTTSLDSLNAYNKSREQLKGFKEKQSYNNLYQDSFLTKPVGWKENYYYKIKPSEGDIFEIDSGTYYNLNIQPDSMAVLKQSERFNNSLGEHAVKNIPLYPKPTQQKENGGEIMKNKKKLKLKKAGNGDDLGFPSKNGYQHIGANDPFFGELQYNPNTDKFATPWDSEKMWEMGNQEYYSNKYAKPTSRIYSYGQQSLNSQNDLLNEPIQKIQDNSTISNNNLQNTSGNLGNPYQYSTVNPNILGNNVPNTKQVMNFPIADYQYDERKWATPSAPTGMEGKTQVKDIKPFVNSPKNNQAPEFAMPNIFSNNFYFNKANKYRNQAIKDFSTIGHDQMPVSAPTQNAQGQFVGSKNGGRIMQDGGYTDPFTLAGGISNAVLADINTAKGFTDIFGTMKMNQQVKGIENQQRRQNLISQFENPTPQFSGGWGGNQPLEGAYVPVGKYGMEVNDYKHYNQGGMANDIVHAPELKGYFRKRKV